MSRFTFSNTKASFNQLKLPALSALALALIACGGGGSSSSNHAPVAKQKNIGAQVQTGTSKSMTLAVIDADNDVLNYSISTQPTYGTATVDAKTGKVTYTAGNVVADDTFVVTASDGKAEAKVTVTMSAQTKALFDYQFYKVKNPTTGNYQIVRYDPNDTNADTNQKVIKPDVILGKRVFVLAADKDGDKKVYKKREYAVFLDPSASFETRTATNRKGETYEYRHYKDNILKRFATDNPAQEDAIFDSSKLPSDLKAQGLTALSGDYKLFVNETDTSAGSYVQLKAQERLPDLIKGESSQDIKSTYLTVRLDDSAAVQGRPLKPVVNSTTGRTQGVLINHHDATKAGEADNAKLKYCDAMLKNCKDVATGGGAYYFQAENDDYIYLAKAGDASFYAFKKRDQSLTKVAGAGYPAPYDPVHHAIMRGLGHGGSGVLSDFSSLTVTNYTLSEGADTYRLINYNLDTKDPAWTFKSRSGFELPQFAHKNGMIVKFNGTTATRIFDTGNGKDLKDGSENVPFTGQLNLIAVKDGNLFVEMGKYDAAAKANVLSSGWITKTSYDGKPVPTKSPTTTVTSQNVPYFTAHQVPSVAVGDSVYVVEVPTDNGAGGRDAEKKRIYNVYKLPITDTSKTKADVTPVRGRMFFERRAARPSGIYEGSVLTWNVVNGEIRNATNNILVGKDTNPKTSNALAGNTGNMVGVGGMFGLHLSMSHGGAYDLASGESRTQNSLKIINKTNGSWIFD